MLNNYSKTQRDIEFEKKENRQRYQEIEHAEQEISNLRIKYQDLTLSLKRSLDKLAHSGQGQMIDQLLSTENDDLLVKKREFEQVTNEYQQALKREKTRLEKQYETLLKETKEDKKEGGDVPHEYDQ